VRRLVEEPVWIARELGIQGRLIDIGSGNGSPAIPICATRRISAAVLVESRLKRSAFLRHVVESLSLSCVAVYRVRLEDAGVELKRLEPDWITIQAVSLNADLLAALSRIVSKTTQIVWITARAKPPAEQARVIRVPESETEAWVFRI
jgi:16S rRNA G527 N7-methylase RsmG